MDLIKLNLIIKKETKQLWQTNWSELKRIWLYLVIKKEIKQLWQTNWFELNWTWLYLIIKKKLNNYGKRIDIKLDLIGLDWIVWHVWLLLANIIFLCIAMFYGKLHDNSGTNHVWLAVLTAFNHNWIALNWIQLNSIESDWI